MRTVRNWGAAAVLLSAVAVAGLAACGGKEPKPAQETTAVQSGGAVALNPGEQVFQRCATCHQPNGQGLATTYPPLAGSEFANAKNPAVPIRVLLHGLSGPVTVKGTQFNGLMPQYGTGIEMSDQEIADVLTYVRSSFGNSASAVTPEMVATQRAATKDQKNSMTEADLKKLM
ncbi:MAG TPA: cytochrome c [Gemmatimonadaceae bacterium]